MKLMKLRVLSACEPLAIDRENYMMSIFSRRERPRSQRLRVAACVECGSEATSVMHLYRFRWFRRSMHRVGIHCSSCGSSYFLPYP